MGVVYLARREADQAAGVALKVISSRPSPPCEVVLGRFLRESEHPPQALDHPNIVRFLDIGFCREAGSSSPWSTSRGRA